MCYITSRFTRSIVTADGSILLFNTYTGRMRAVPAEWQEAVTKALREGFDDQDPSIDGFFRLLQEDGYFIPEGTNEMRLARERHQEYMGLKEVQELIIMPTEQCNFRCVYCYESFIKPKMPPAIRKGVKLFVQKRAAASPPLQLLITSWFGGEPLAAFDVIRELSQSFLDTCADHNVAYVSGITTNGYFLVPKVADELLDLKVRTFQITLDGPREHHNRRRKLIGGQGTFDRIFENLKYLKTRPQPFKVAIRVNFDRLNYPNLPEFLDSIRQEFGSDKRFSMMFRPIERWGGPNDARLPVFEGKEAEKVETELALMSTARGLQCYDADLIQPGAHVCYAAKPWSLVIGSDGTIYKCTILFSNEKNQVGKLKSNGELVLDQEKFALWTRDYAAEDKGCQSCFFMPSCQGAACPAIRITQGRRPCPTAKRHFTETLRYTWQTMQIRNGTLFTLAPTNGHSSPSANGNGMSKSEAKEEVIAENSSKDVTGVFCGGS